MTLANERPGLRVCGLRARNSLKRISPRPFDFLETTDSPGNAGCQKTRDTAGRSSDSAVLPYRKIPLTSFNDFGLAEPILRALAEENYATPTPIQAQTIPLVLTGRDVIGIAQTGTGKTAAFALPILNHLYTKRMRPERKSCRVLVLSPTRELSGQIADSFRAYGRHMRPLGGRTRHRRRADQPSDPRSRARRRSAGRNAGPSARSRAISARSRSNQVEILVLDEADRMLDMGFIHDIRKIVAMLPQGAADAVFLGHHAAGNHQARRLDADAIPTASP